MNRIFSRLSILLLTFFLSFCNGKKEPNAEINPQVEIAKAEAEAAKQKALAAEAERKKIEAELTLEKEKWRIEKEKTNEITKKKAEEAKKLSYYKNKISEDALKLVKNNGQQILQQAYPFAMKKLRYQSAKLIGITGDSKGYSATVRLNYTNLFRKLHSLDLRFGFDSNGGYRHMDFVNHTDIVGPKELSLKSLLKFVN